MMLAAETISVAVLDDNEDMLAALLEEYGHRLRTAQWHAPAGIGSRALEGHARWHASAG